MTRKKLNVAYITNESKRNTSFAKRKNGLIKKVDEINTLCGIEACAIIVNPNDPRSEVWPLKLEAQNVIDMFRAIPEEEKTKKMLDQEAYLRERIMKAQEELRKQREENKKNEMTHLMHQILHTGQIPINISTADLNNLSSLIDEHLKEVEQRIDGLKAEEVVVQNVGVHAMTDGEEKENMGHSQGLLIGGEELTNMGHAQGPTSNMNVLQNDQHLSMDFNNNSDGVLPIGHVDVSNGVWPNPTFL